MAGDSDVAIKICVLGVIRGKPPGERIPENFLLFKQKSCIADGKICFNGDYKVFGEIRFFLTSGEGGLLPTSKLVAEADDFFDPSSRTKFFM